MDDQKQDEQEMTVGTAVFIYLVCISFFVAFFFNYFRIHEPRIVSISNSVLACLLPLFGSFIMVSAGKDSYDKYSIVGTFACYIVWAECAVLAFMVKIGLITSGFEQIILVGLDWAMKGVFFDFVESYELHFTNIALEGNTFAIDTAEFLFRMLWSACATYFVAVTVIRVRVSSLATSAKSAK